MSEYEAIEAFEDMLNEAHGTVKVCGMRYDAGSAWRTLDPTAFREAFNNWLDTHSDDDDDDDEETFEVPKGNAVVDRDGTVWVREGGLDRWTQRNMPAFVPRVTAKQLTPWGPFTKA